MKRRFFVVKYGDKFQASFLISMFIYNHAILFIVVFFRFYPSKRHTTGNKPKILIKIYIQLLAYPLLYLFPAPAKA